MRKLSVLIGTAVVGAMMPVAILTTATLAQGTGPGYIGQRMMGGQGTIQCARRSRRRNRSHPVHRASSAMATGVKVVITPE